MLSFLDRLFHAVSVNRLAQRFTLLNRMLLAGGFIPTGLVKILGRPFTMMSGESTVGRFFEIFYENQLWYQSVGWVQLVAGILLLVPGTAHLGAFLFFPVILNIHLVTYGYGFNGTPFITGAMVLANLWLVCWEYPRWRTWLTQIPGQISYQKTLNWIEKAGLIIGFPGLLGLLAFTRSFVPATSVKFFVALFGAGFIVALFGTIMELRGRYPWPRR